MRLSFRNTIIALVILLIIAVAWGVFAGQAGIPCSEIFRDRNRQILSLRLARILLSMVAGSGLAVLGVALQAILKNPLAEPYLLGTSSGAGLGAVVAIVAGLSSIYTPFAAFLGTLLSIFLVYAIGRRGNKVPVQSMILAGVIVSMAFSALIAFLVSISGNAALNGIMWWLWGSMQVYDIKLLFIVTGLVLIGIGTIYFFSQDLNAITIGEEEARHLGINIETVKKIIFFATAIVTGSLVSICGVIGFVGLIIPHAARLLVGPNHKVLIPTACLGAACFMIACDTISRTILPPMEIPIGVITTMIGTPIFIILLKRSQRVR
jgi:iron complex transport system permease protein